MNNWWIAVLEYQGIIDYEAAEHLSEYIDTSIGNSKYRDASKTIKQVLDSYYASHPKSKKKLANS